MGGGEWSIILGRCEWVGHYIRWMGVGGGEWEWRNCLIMPQKIDALQVVVSDEDACDQNGKASNTPSLIPSNCCH